MNDFGTIVRLYKKNMRILKEKPGIISPNACWVAVDDEYLYIEDTLLKLLYVLLTEWKHDKHFAGGY